MPRIQKKRMVPVALLALGLSGAVSWAAFEPQPPEPRITLELKQQPVMEALTAVFRRAGMTYRTEGVDPAAIRGVVTSRMTDVPLSTAVRLMLRNAQPSLVCRRGSDGTYVLCAPLTSGKAEVSTSTPRLTAPENAAVGRPPGTSGSSASGTQAVGATTLTPAPHWQRPTVGELGAKPLFTLHSPLVANDRLVFTFGVPNEQMNRAVNRVFRAMTDPAMDWRRSESVEQLASRISLQMKRVIDMDPSTAGLSAFAREWLMAEAVCAWVSTHVIAANDIPTDNAQERIRRGQAQVVLDQIPPSAVCSGFARLTRDLGRACGLKVEHLGGDYRPAGQPAPSQSNHGWVCFELAGHIRIPADPTLSRVDLVRARAAGAKSDPYRTLPRSPAALELFLAEYFSYQILDGLGKFKSSTDYNCSTMSHEQWKAIDTSRYVVLSSRLAQYSRRR